MSTKVVNIILIDNGVGTGESALGFVSKSMEQNNIAASTRKRYAGCVRIIKNWFHENEYEHRDVLFDDSENLLLITARNRDYYRRFFAYLMSNGVARSKLSGPDALDTELYPDPYSLPTIEGYRSAIV